MTQKPTITLGRNQVNIVIANIITFCMEGSRICVTCESKTGPTQVRVEFSNKEEYAQGVKDLTDARDAYLAGQEAPPALVDGVRIYDITSIYRDGDQVHFRRDCQEHEEILLMDSSAYQVFYRMWEEWQQYAAMQSLR